MSITELKLTGLPGPAATPSGGTKISLGPYVQFWPTGVGGSIRIITAKSSTIPPLFRSTIPAPLPPEIGDAGPWTRPWIPYSGTKTVDVWNRGTFILEYDGTVVTLPWPMLGDVQTLQSTVINRRTRGGRQRVYRDLQWYTLHVYEYSFKHVRESIKDSFLALVKDAMADPIKVTDHLGNEYDDMFITNVAPVVEEHDDDCSYNIGITVQVVR